MKYRMYNFFYKSKEEKAKVFTDFRTITMATLSLVLMASFFLIGGWLGYSFMKAFDYKFISILIGIIITSIVWLILLIATLVEVEY